MSERPSLKARSPCELDTILSRRPASAQLRLRICRIVDAPSNSVPLLVDDAAEEVRLLSVTPTPGVRYALGMSTAPAHSSVADIGSDAVHPHNPRFD